MTSRLPGRTLRRLALGSLLGAAGTLMLGCSGDDDDDTSGAGATGAGGNPGTGGQGSGTGGQGSGTGGEPVQSTFPDAQAYVDAHNAVRASVTEPAGYAGTWAPLPPVTWSDTVAQSAQEWANHLRDELNCGLEHAQGSGYGENLAGGWGLDPQGAVDMWANEVSEFSYTSPFEWNSGAGHYSQIVWRTSTEIGCASASCGDSSVIVCRYSPAGNMIGGEIW